MDVSVVVCTYDRSSDLDRALGTLVEMAVPATYMWELVVVDNNSGDSTRDVCEKWAGSLPLRYLHEPEQGKSFALNRAVDECRGRLLAFTDDDVDVDRGWIAALLSAADRWPQASVFGGRVVPQWSQEPPKWFREYQKSLLAALALSIDHGNEERELPRYEDAFVGANLAVRKSVFSDGVRFRQDIGPTGGSQVRGEETALLRLLREAGHTAVYVPTAVVQHRNPPERATESYVRQWFRGRGVSEVRTGQLEGGACLFGAPLWCWREAAINTLKYGVTRFGGSSRTWLRAEARASAMWGAVSECRRQHGH